MTGYKSRRRWQVERWVGKRKQELQQQWLNLQEQLLPASWPARCERAPDIADGNASRWQPQPGSSSAELALLLSDMGLAERQLLASLLDAPCAGVFTLVEAVERLQLEWRQRLDPLHSHRDYAAQLETLVRLLGLIPAARAAYLENEQRIGPAIDRLLFESLPMRMHAEMASRLVPGEGGYLSWWQKQLLARAGVPGYEREGLGDNDWPEIPPAWFALGWIVSQRHQRRGRPDGSGTPGHQGGA